MLSERASDDECAGLQLEHSFLLYYKRVGNIKPERSLEQAIQGVLQVFVTS